MGQDPLLERISLRCSRAATSSWRACPASARRWRSGPWPRRRRRVQPHPVHAGPRARRPRRDPDLQPADRRLHHLPRPVLTNLLLADEINRAPAKVQSALLEVMQEHQVTIGRETHPVPEPFLVLATQNPIETEGTYALPEAQVDRFMLKVVVDYPTDRRVAIVVRMTTPSSGSRRSSRRGNSSRLKQVDAVFVDPALNEYAVRLAVSTRLGGGSGCPTSSATSPTARARGRRST